MTYCVLPVMAFVGKKTPLENQRFFAVGSPISTSQDAEKDIGMDSRRDQVYAYQQVQPIIGNCISFCGKIRKEYGGCGHTDCFQCHEQVGIAFNQRRHYGISFSHAHI